ncbi:Zinc finger CCCH domain-containing protein 13 [Triplophysa tibetana]|uniref:Zinc finger CCCH domain-containing protein 13 n=1 Tax=Triplophysa tibetana TaxID=1572043 RepID=A0A5A9PND6_9TELE|nr:Zinc finger CCCH domain-containing protein 13 [Triplophysa tibetana]
MINSEPCRMSKIRRKVTVENSKTISDSSNSTTTPSRRPSVFERLGPSTASNAAETHCRNWLKTGNCSYGNACRYTHGTPSQGKGFSGAFHRSAERPTGDLRERMKNKRQDVDGDAQKRDTDEPTSPATRGDSSRRRHRVKEDIKITKEHTPASEEETQSWEASREDSDNGDYDYELSLEMKRQKIQRELMKLEQENMDKREEVIIKKETSPEHTSSKGSPSSRKSSGSPKHRAAGKDGNSSKKEKSSTLVISSPMSDQTRTAEADSRSSKSSQNKRKGPQTPSPPPPVPAENLVIVKKHKNKHKNKEKSEDKFKDVKERRCEIEKHKEKKEKRRSRTPPCHRRSPSPRSGQQHSPSSHSGSSAQRHSPSPRHGRDSVSPSYQRDIPNSSSFSPPPIQSSQRSHSPRITQRDPSASPAPRSSSSHQRTQARERGRGDRDKSPVQLERRHERREECPGKREKDSSRDEREYDIELISSRDTRDSRDHRGDRRDAREERQPRGEFKDSRDAHATETRNRSGRESQQNRDKERERERERERNEAPRKEDTTAQEERNYGRGHGKEEVKNVNRADNKNESRAERTGRGRGRGADAQDQKGYARGNKASQADTSSTCGRDSWESRGSFRERSSERSSNRDRYDHDRPRGEQARDDRKVGHTERDHRDNREREQRAPSSGRVEDLEREERRDDRRNDRGEERRDERIRDREKDKDREKEREKEREKDREREAEKERERAREREREEKERGREREERERERERERKEREREREQRERERQREWEERERERGREERRERRDESRDDRSGRDTQEERKNTRKRHRTETTPSPRPSPKRAREVSPADSEGYNSTEEKGDKHRLLSQVVRPQDTPNSPVHLFTDDKRTRWKDEDHCGDKHDSRGRHEEVDYHNERARRLPERRGEQAPDGSANTSVCDSRRAKEQRELPTAALIPSALVEDRNPFSAIHEEGKKKPKCLRKNLKKSHKEEDGPAGEEERCNLEAPPCSTLAKAHQHLSPRKTPKKKGLDRKRKRSGGVESDISDDELVTQQPVIKRRHGPHTPPSIKKDELASQRALAAGQGSLTAKIDASFSDWSDEDVPERGESSAPQLSERIQDRMLLSERPHGRCTRGGGRDHTDPPIAPLLPDPPMLIQSLPLQPLLPQHMLRKPQQADKQQHSTMGSNQSRGSSRRLRSSSNESAQRDEAQQGPGSRRGRMQGANSRDRDRDREREREKEKDRDRAVASEYAGGERKSRIDKLRRGEPSRSTSSVHATNCSHSSLRSSPELRDTPASSAFSSINSENSRNLYRQDSRSQSSRRSSPESERQARSRAGSYESRERDRDREQLDRERERNRQMQNQQPQQREERLLPEGPLSHDKIDRNRGERERERERILQFNLQTHREPKSRAEVKIERVEYEPLLPREALIDVEKPVNISNLQGEASQPEKMDHLEGKSFFRLYVEDAKGDDGHSVSGGEEYEPISDDELDEILADSQKRDEQLDDEKISGPVDVIDVDWSSLIPRQQQETRAPGAALFRFTPGAVLLKAGVSRSLAGPQLLGKVKEVCSRELKDPKDADKMLEHDMGALNMAAYSRRMERANLLRSLSHCCKALCARRDVAIRKQLLKNDRGTTKQIYTSAPVVDNELMTLCLRLFKKKISSTPSSGQKSDLGSASQQLSTPAELCASQPHWVFQPFIKRNPQPREAHSRSSSNPCCIDPPQPLASSFRTNSQFLIILYYQKKKINEALVNMVIKDSQPFSIVDDDGFRELLHVVDPTYVIPTLKGLKAMVKHKYKEAKEKAREQLQKVAAISLTSDMWTSLNMDAFLAVTCPFIDDNDKLCTILLDVEHFPKSHTAENLATGHIKLMDEWGIKDKVKYLVTDVAANMIACV